MTRGSYVMIDRRPYQLVESGDPLAIPAPPSADPNGYQHGHRTTESPSALRWWFIASVVMATDIVLIALAYLRNH